MSNGYVIPFEYKLRCSICQDRLKDVRSLPCGHTFCKGCLTQSAQTSYPRGYIKCAECQKSSPVPPSGGVDSLPRCFILNGLIEDITQTFGGGDGRSTRTVSIGQHGFQARETFNCTICMDLMTDARYLPCGHSFCKACLIKQPQQTSRSHIRCCKCLGDHTLPFAGVAGLPISYRINSIVAELKKNEKWATPMETSPGSSTSGVRQANGCAGRQRPPSGSTNRTMMEDVDEAKRRAQARAPGAAPMQVFVQKMDGRTITLDVRGDDTIATLKRKIQDAIGLASSQLRLTWCSKNLNDNTMTLQDYGITNQSTICINGRLRGGATK